MGGVGLALVAGCGRWPGQAPARPWRLGFLAPAAANQPETMAQYAALWAGLRELGYIEGENLVVEYRYAGGQDERLPTLAGELAQLKVDLIVAAGPGAAKAAKDATTTIPVVVPTSNAPVETGLVASLARPGGNVTGLSLMAPMLGSKRLDLLSQVLPGLAHVGVLVNPVEVAVDLDWAEVQRGAEALGVRLQRVDAPRLESFGGAFEAFARDHAEALLVLPGPLFSRERTRIVELAALHGLPGIYEHRLFSVDGGLLAYGPNLVDNYRRAGKYVDKILNGASPADLPVEQPNLFDFAINLKTAQALGLTIPPHVLLQATEVIQ